MRWLLFLELLFSCAVELKEEAAAIVLCPVCVVAKMQSEAELWRQLLAVAQAPVKTRHARNELKENIDLILTFKKRKLSIPRRYIWINLGHCKIDWWSIFLNTCKIQKGKAPRATWSALEGP